MGRPRRRGRGVINDGTFWAFWIVTVGVIFGAAGWVWLLDRREERAAEDRRQRWAAARMNAEVARSRVPDHIPADWLEQ
jgi:hypothetical protein